MNFKKHILLKTNLTIALLSSLFLLKATAQTVRVSFDSDDYKSVGVFDAWEDSPFRKGELQWTCDVTDNPQPMESATQTSGKVLRIVRSRYGSNQFGARVNLKSPFSLKPETQYVHVMLWRPVVGRVMLMGLGKHREPEWSGQSKETIQFEVLSSNYVAPNRWVEAVFPIKGASGVDIYSLVIVPDCESPHDLQNDFTAYIDNIEVNNQSAQAKSYEDYPVSFDAANTYVVRTDRGILNVGFDGKEKIEITKTPSANDLLYHDKLSESISCMAGETLKPVFGFKGTWMCGYAYIDWGSDGFFSKDLQESGRPDDGSDLVSYSAYNQKNSAGESLANNNTLNMPAFEVPATTKKGFYRMRFKVDWDNIDPAGSETIQDNGGGIVDVRLNVHENTVSVQEDNRNGAVLSSDGSPLPVSVPFGEALTVKLNPENGFTYNGLRIRHGYNLSGDSLVHGTPQYIDEIVFRPRFDNENCFTIPGKWVDGDLLLEGLFVEQGTEMEFNYPINFERDALLGRTDRHLDAVTMNGTSFEINTGKNADDGLLYHEDMRKTFFADSGEEITTTFSYTGTWMNGYVYVDRGRDGSFSWEIGEGGNPTPESDLMAYSHYNGKNSKGTSVQGNTLNPPTFIMPTLPDGFYRIRFKIDWDSLDPGGNTSETNSILKNAGGIADARLRICNQSLINLNIEENPNGKLLAADGTLLPSTTAYRYPLDIKVAPAEGYRLDKLICVHGVLTGAEIIHDVPQRLTKTFTYDDIVDGKITLPADLIDGDVQLSASFIPEDGYVPPTTSTLRAEQTEGGEVLYFNGTSLSDAISVPDSRNATILIYPEPGQKLSSLTIISGEEELSIATNQLSLNRYDIPARLFQDKAQVVCKAEFLPLEAGETGWKKVWKFTWGDEFDTDGLIRPDAAKWGVPSRYNSAWNRYIADSEEVSYVSQGNYVARCIANPNTTEDNAEMISGAIQSRSKYSFLYGRVESRIKTTPHTGNFPAFWLMPQEQPDGWPKNGEIDIMEQINTQNVAHQNIHTNWSYNLGKKSDPPSSGSCSVNMTQWHDYALEWDAKQLRWFVDGSRVFSYAKKSTDADALSKGQWPFDHEFYIILNQSVGNGSWASNPDKSFQYETLFDYVRVYQLFDRDDITGALSVTKNQEDTLPWYDLQGRRIMKPTTPGIYIHGRKKVYVGQESLGL